MKKQEEGGGAPAHLLPEGQRLQRPGVLHSMTEEKESQRWLEVEERLGRVNGQPALVATSGTEA